MRDDLGAEGHVVNQAGRRCVNDACDAVIGDDGAYLHRDRDEGGLCLFCPACSLMIRLHHSLRFPLVAL
jgi:hypothetical protein